MPAEIEWEASVPVAAPGDRVGDVRSGLIGRAFGSAEEVVVCEAQRPVGVVSLGSLLAADAGLTVGELMIGPPATVPEGTGSDRIAHAILDAPQSNLVVVDRSGRLVGVIPAARRLELLQRRHERDMARIGGYLVSTELARGAAVESLAQRLGHRLPWLLIGLAGAMLSAVLVGAFERQLEGTVLVAFFVPAVVYMADAVGTQTEAVLIRALPTGVTVRSVFARELLTGFIMGAGVGVAFFSFAAFIWGDAEVALAVGLALWAGCSIATLVAMALPALLVRLGRDPAFGSGPLATVVQDLLSIAVYLGIVAAILG